MVMVVWVMLIMIKLQAQLEVFIEEDVFMVCKQSYLFMPNCEKIPI